MARISTYGKDNTLNNKDKVLGSSYVRTVGNVDEFETKNFTLEELNGFFAAEGSALSISLKSNGGIVRETIDNTTKLAVDLGASNITGQLANADLANSSITINGTAISLGGTVTTPDTQLTDTQVRSKISVTGGGASYDNSTGVITLPSQFTLATGNVTNASVSGQTLTLNRQSASDITFTPTANDFTNTLKTKLDNIESNATADQTASEIKTLYESNSDTNAFTDNDHSKLDGIEASADVTDTTNVVAALTAGTNVAIASDGTISSTDNNTQLSKETVQDYVGEMLSSNTETRITVTYDDANNKINFVADDQSYTLPTASSSTLGGVKVGGNLTIDGSGVLNVGAIALTTVQTAANESAHLALTAQEGDIVVRSDQNKSYVHNGGTAGNMNDYTLLLTPTDAVLSVTTTDGSYINLTPNSATTGAINIAADLSAVNGTSDTTTRFLSQDNTWDVPSYTTNTFRTVQADGAAIGATETLNLIGGTNVTLSESNGAITIAATDTDTNTFRTVEVDSNGNGSANTTLGASETLRFKKGSNITLSEAAGVITISSTDTNDNTFRTVTAGGNTLGATETLAFTAGSNVTITENAGAVTIASTDTNTQLSDSQVRSKISGTGLISYNNSTGVISTSANNYSLPAAADGTRGGVQIGYTENGKNYPVELASEKMFVNVPWTDTNTDTNTQNTTTLSFVDSSNDIILRNTTGGAGSGNQDIKFVAGANITLNHTDANNIEIVATDTNTDTNTNILSGGTITGDVTVNGDMTFEDGHKLELGTGADLDLYHTSNNSYIDNNTGNLYIRCHPSGEIHLRPKESENGVIIRNDGGTELYFDNAKKLETVTGGVNVTGAMTASGDVVAFSDKRLKSDIKTLDGSKVYGMRGVSFIKDNKQSSGVIAQELEKIAPELVNNEGEYKAVAYGNVVGYLIEAIKDLKAEVEQLKKQIK